MYNSKTLSIMKKILLSISAVMAMMAMTATFSACSSDDEQESSSAKLIINASRGNYGQFTRNIALSDNDNIVTTWKKSDNVFAYKEGWTGQIGTLNPKDDSNNNVTKLEGDVKAEGLSVGSNIEFITPRNEWDYTGQDGTIPTISSKYDYATARVQVTFFDQDNKVYGTTASFETQQAIIKYKLFYIDKDDNTKKALNVKTLTIVAGQGKLVKSRDLDGKNVVYGGLEVTSSSANGTSEFYVALRNDYTGADTYTLTAKDKNGTIYTSATSAAHTYSFRDYISHEVVLSAYDDTYTERDTYKNKVEQTW